MHVNEAHELRKIRCSDSLDYLISSAQGPTFFKEILKEEMKNYEIKEKTLSDLLCRDSDWTILLVGLLVLDAQIETVSKKILSINSFVTNSFNDELLNLLIPHKENLFYKNIYREKGSERASSMVALSILKSDQKISDIIISCGGIFEKTTRLHELEDQIIEGSLANADAVQDFVLEQISRTQVQKQGIMGTNYINSVMVAETVGRSMRS